MDDPPYRSEMGVPVLLVLITHGIELQIISICAAGHRKDGLEHMLLFGHWGNDAVLLPDDHQLATRITIQNDTDIILVMGVRRWFERAEFAVWIGGQWPSSMKDVLCCIVRSYRTFAH